AELEVFLPGRDAFETLEAKLEHPRQGHIAVPLETNGAVLIAGGSGAGQPLSTTEIFEPWDNRIVAAGELTAPRVALAGVALEDGGVLALGGRNADGASRSCGVLTPGIALRFTQTRYRPLEVAVIQGSVGTTLPAPVTMALSLQRINLTTGVTVAANDRLLVQSITIPVSGNLPQTAVMNVVRDDIGHDFVLRAGRETAAQARFGVRLTTALTLSPALPVIAGSPARMRLTLTADGAPVNMSGTRTAVVGARSAATITLSDLAASSISEFSICCETAPGVVQTSGRYSGNVFLEPSSVAGTIIIGNPAPAVRIAPAALRLQEPGQILVEVQFDAASIDPNAPPRGTLALSRNGTVIATAPLANNLVLDSGIPRGALFPFTPSAADRRTTPCFMVEYAGDSRYTAIRSPITCLSVGPAATGLQVSIGTSTVYTLGENRTVTARLTWPDSVGIVGRTVNVTAGGQSVAAITLTPDPTGRGIATGSASVKLPFQTGAVVFTYPQSGDLSLASNTIRTTMAPVSTTMLINVPSPTTNPFTVRYTLRLNTGGVSLPPGTNVGGSVQILDGTEVLATQTLPALPGISDGTSNTITFEAPTIPGLLTNVIRPLGQRTIRVRFTGSPLFAASEATAVVTVQ
ncbi:MAG TPA: hypothetical protein VM120_00610, partial [Bryobacteraceae bacterium]|nr:hypothetical protein [Bryobacteraceae bacterium]